MASPALRRLAWPAAALVAAGVLVALALRGGRPGAGFARYEPEGPMVHLAPAQVTAVEIARDGRRWRFVRAGEGGGWKAAPASQQAGAAPAGAIERGLRFLHGSAPQRVMAPEELAGTPLAEIGLAPPRLVVSVFTASGTPFVVELGSPNPQGLARYARVAGHRDVLLLNRYVVEAWEEAIAP